MSDLAVGIWLIVLFMAVGAAVAALFAALGAPAWVALAVMIVAGAAGK